MDHRQTERPGRFLASDLDGTLIPVSNDAAGREGIRRFRDACANQRAVTLVYVTGRHFALALDGISSWQLPEPQVLICDVGTSIYRRTQGAWHLDEGYAASLEKRWSAASADSLGASLASLPGLTLQEAERQTRFKRSYYVDAASAAERVTSRVEERLRQAGLDATLIYSVDHVRGVGLLDLLPPGTAKDTGLDFLCEAEGASREEVVYAGDSGNDLAVFAAGYRSIVVGNTPEAVKQQARKEAASRNIEALLYFAKGDAADGVLEGARHFGVL